MSGPDRVTNTNEEILHELSTSVKIDPGSVVDRIDELLHCLMEGDDREKIEAAKILRELTESVPREAAHYFDGIIRYVGESNLDVQLILIQACDNLRGFISDEDIWHHQEILISVLKNRSNNDEIVESIAGLIYNIARYNPESIIPHIDIVSTLLYSDITEATTNALLTLESVAKQDTNAVYPYADELLELIEYTVIPDEIRPALSTLVYIVIDNPDYEKKEEVINILRKLAVCNNEFIVQESIKEIGNLVATNEKFSEDLLDLVVKNLYSGNEDIRKQAMIECLRIANHHARIFVEADMINASYVSDRVQELNSEFNYSDRFEDIQIIIEKINSGDPQ